MGRLYVVPTPVGNMDDITLRALRVLGSVGVVLAEDTRTTGVLFKHHGIKNRLVSHHKYNEHEKVSGIVQRIKDGEDVALVSDAGTPGISDPGFLLVREAIKSGIDVECLPGATAFVPALIDSGLPCDRFVFEGFLPLKKGRRSRIEALSKESRTMIFYESPRRLVRTLQQLSEVFGADRHACVVREISKLHEECLRLPLNELSLYYEEHPAKGEIVIVVAGNEKGF